MLLSQLLFALGLLPWVGGRMLRARARAIPSFRASLDLEWHVAGAEEPEGCRGSISWDSAARMRLRGHTAVFFTVFDLVAADGLVWLDVPREKTLVHGRRADPAWRR